MRRCEQILFGGVRPSSVDPVEFGRIRLSSAEFGGVRRSSAELGESG